jgi:hypothetical protein
LECLSSQFDVCHHKLSHSIRPGGPSLAAEVFGGLAKVPFYHMGKMEGIREPAAIGNLGRSMARLAEHRGAPLGPNSP